MADEPHYPAELRFPGGYPYERDGRGFRAGDDGYDWMDLVERQGWRCRASWGRDGWDLGDWPYVVYATAHSSHGFHVAEHCEGDVTVWTYATQDEQYAKLDRCAAYWWERWTRGREGRAPAGFEVGEDGRGTHEAWRGPVRFERPAIGDAGAWEVRA